MVRNRASFIQAIAGAVYIAAVVALGAGPADARQAFDRAWQLCGQHTQLFERRQAIPHHLLTAVSLAESGRWDDSRRAIVAWPWTVTSGSDGRFFDTKAEALAHIEILRSRGVTNIDVGCMQINLHYHGEAFESLSEMLEPAVNVAYAADFLNRLKTQEASWTNAAGRYHSNTPERHARYRKKVLRLWGKLRGMPDDMIAAVDPTKTTPPVGGSTSIHGNSPIARPMLKTHVAKAPKFIDRNRTKRLNAAFRVRAEAQATQRPVAGKGNDDVRRQQLAAWRDARSRPSTLKHLLALRKAELARKRRDEMKRYAKIDRAKVFSAKRKKQLERWRLNSYTPPTDPAAPATAKTAPATKNPS